MVFVYILPKGFIAIFCPTLPIIILLPVAHMSLCLVFWFLGFWNILQYIIDFIKCVVIFCNEVVVIKGKIFVMEYIFMYIELKKTSVPQGKIPALEVKRHRIQLTTLLNDAFMCRMASALIFFFPAYNRNV
jgi:hypothetical protein